MAYNYGNYYGNYPNQMYQPSITQATPNPSYQPWQPMLQQPSYNYSQGSGGTSIVWVQGEADARAYPVAPGQRAIMMDSEALYIKSADVTGRPMPLEVYDLVKRENVVDSSEASKGNEYVTKADLEATVEALVNKALER